MSRGAQVLVVSDSHGNRRALNTIIRDFSKVQYLFHLGDNVRDAAYLSTRMPETCVLSVRGNCDPGSKEPTYEEIVLCGQRIILTHGHTLNVKWGLDRAIQYAEDHDADALLYGHTHVPAVERYGPTWLINPGSAGEARGRAETVAMMLVGENGIIPKIIRLNL